MKFLYRRPNMDRRPSAQNCFKISASAPPIARNPAIVLPATANSTLDSPLITHLPFKPPQSRPVPPLGGQLLCNPCRPLAAVDVGTNQRRGSMDSGPPLH